MKKIQLIADLFVPIVILHKSAFYFQKMPGSQQIGLIILSKPVKVSIRVNSQQIQNNRTQTVCRNAVFFQFKIRSVIIPNQNRRLVIQRGIRTVSGLQPKG